jgi:hypothetical protein
LEAPLARQHAPLHGSAPPAIPHFTFRSSYTDRTP